MNQSVTDLITILDLHDLHQICNGPTHIKGSSLDAINTKPDLVSLKTTTLLDWFDHYLILFHINSQPKRCTTLAKKYYHWTCNLKNISQDELELRIINQFQPKPQLLSTILR